LFVEEDKERRSTSTIELLEAIHYEMDFEGLVDPTLIHEADPEDVT